MRRPGRIAVVGAGPAGLTAAYRLMRAGVAVTVLEAQGWVGGRMRTDDLDGARVDAGAQLFGSMYARLLSLIEEVGLGDSLVRSPGRDALWRGDRAHEVTYGSVGSMLASGGLPMRTKLRLGTTYLPFLASHAASLDLHAPELAARAGLDGETIASWGTRELDSDFVELLVYPQLAAYYGTLPEETSAALYHTLARQGLDVALYALRGGTQRLCEALADRVRSGGGEMRLDTRVDAARPGADGVRVDSDVGEENFDAVVLAVPAPVARDLLGDSLPALSGWLGRVRYRPALTVALRLDRPAGVRYFGLSFPREAGGPLAAVCVEENKGGELVPRGEGLLLALVRPEVVASMLDAEPRAILDAILPPVERAFPGLRGAITHARVFRWPTGNPVFAPGHLGRLGTIRTGAAEGGGPVALAGDYLHSPTVEGAVASGEAAAARLLSRRSAARP